jgi:8-oxo-dGTP pyrophosphatase MutT (NUDIX family)
MTWSTTGWVDDTVAGPSWLMPIREAVHGSRVEDLTRFVPPADAGRHAAVLVLFGEDVHGPDLLLIKRAADLRNHPGQPAFPGGAVDQADDNAAAAALREAAEETGVEPSGVHVFGQLPDLWVPVTNYVVTPVLGWWAQPVPVQPRDASEVESVHRISIEDFIDPANRCRARHPSGYTGPAFLVDDLVVWGFTAGLLSTLFDRAGLSQPWDEERIVTIDGVEVL